MTSVKAQVSTDSVVFYENMVAHPQDLNHLPKAYIFFNTQKEKAVQQKDTMSQMFSLFQLARIAYKSGSYYDSESAAVEALQLSDQLKETDYNTHFRKSLYTQLGILYREQNNKAKAIDLYQKALTIATTTRDSAVIYNNIANIHKDADDYQNANRVLNQAYQLLPRLQDTLMHALILDNKGFLKFKLQEPGALELMLQALDLRTQINNKGATYPSYKNLALFYAQRDSTLSKSYALKAYEVANELNSASYKEDALALLVSMSNDPYSVAYKTLNDSLTEANTLRQNKFALMKYDVSQKERQAQASALQSQREKSKRQLFQIIALGIALVSVLLYLALKSKHKKDKLQQVYHTESRISKKVHDEVANEVYHVITKIQGTAKSDDILDDLEHIYNKTRDISKEHSAIDVTDKFSELLNDLLLSYKTDNTNIITKNLSKTQWELIPDLKKTALYRVLQELMINMRKHSKATVVLISFEQTNKNIHILYKDNGIGTNLQKGNGLTNAENRIKSIYGTITFESQVNTGFKVKIKV
ncbi:tetratricopeptide repeat protein [Flavobacteriaceae bacterium MAR_2010_72]|nr:tetratricopeptide repeat protein [Flavobacteriaceae bacterium MAR_2010_72]